VPEAIVPQNRLRAKLAEGRTVVGTMLVEIRQPSVMDLLANAGLDFVLIDSEHGPFSIGTIADLSRAGRSAGVTPIVRIPELTYSHITQPLDAGAQGIMLPRVTGPEQIAFCLECSSSELRQYIEEHDMDYAPGPTKQYPIHGARWWRPWKANPFR